MGVLPINTVRLLKGFYKLGYEKYTGQFREHAVQSASPLQLVVMLYDGAIKFCDQGLVAMEKRDLDGQNNTLQRAQRIILELMSCLDTERGGEVAKNLLALYTYCINQLVEANIHDTKEPIRRVKKILNELRDSWVSLELQIQNNAARPEGGRPLAA